MIAHDSPFGVHLKHAWQSQALPKYNLVVCLLIGCMAMSLICAVHTSVMCVGVGGEIGGGGGGGGGGER